MSHPLGRQEVGPSGHLCDRATRGERGSSGNSVKQALEAIRGRGDEVGPARPRGSRRRPSPRAAAVTTRPWPRLAACESVPGGISTL